MLCGWTPRFTYRHLAVAAAYLGTGAQLVATNPDTANRVGDRLIPENGAFIAALEAASGCKVSTKTLVARRVVRSSAHIRTKREREHGAMTSDQCFCCQAMVIGKPSDYLAQLLKRELQLAPQRTLMIGDRLDTDIAFGSRAGFATGLVLTGVGSEQEARRAAGTSMAPTYVWNTLSDIVQTGVLNLGSDVDRAA